jgi:hypothetical protein
MELGLLKAQPQLVNKCEVLIAERHKREDERTSSSASSGQKRGKAQQSYIESC